MAGRVLTRVKNTDGSTSTCSPRAPSRPVCRGASFWRRFLAAFLGLGRRASVEPAWSPCSGLEASVARQHRSRPGPRSVHARAPHYRPQPAPPRQTCSLVTDWPPPPGLRARPDQGPSTALGAGLPDHTSPAEVPWFQAKQCRGLSRWPGMIVGRRGCLRGQRPSGDKVFGAVSSVRHLGLISVA